MNLRRHRRQTCRKQRPHRCAEFFPGCIVCESYRFLDQHGRFPTFDEVAPICERATQLTETP